MGCAKSRLPSESSRTPNSPTQSIQNPHDRSQSALSHTSSHRSSRQTTTHESSNTYFSEDDYRDAKQSAHERSFEMPSNENSYPKHKTVSNSKPGLYEPSYIQEGGSQQGDSVEGIECVRCTLVNDRKLRACEACGASLG